MPEEIAWMLAQRHRPLAVGQALSAILQAVDADSIVKSRIDRLISTYTYEFGGCNRIYNTAIPSAYTRYVIVGGSAGGHKPHGSSYDSMITMQQV
jgi:predicted membrane chloride channel (bestrophin family)